MNSVKRLTLFYLFRNGNDIEIRGMTDAEALTLWEQGQRWLDMPKKTFPEAQQLRLHLLASQRP